MGYKTYDCSIASKCGGCEWLNVPYPIQLRRKQEEVEQLFEGLCDNAAIYPIIGMDEPLHCRNKIIVAFAPGKTVLSAMVFMQKAAIVLCNASTVWLKMNSLRQFCKPSPSLHVALNCNLITKRLVRDFCVMHSFV